MVEKNEDERLTISLLQTVATVRSARVVVKCSEYDSHDDSAILHILCHDDIMAYSVCSPCGFTSWLIQKPPPMFPLSPKSNGLIIIFH